MRALPLALAALIVLGAAGAHAEEDPLLTAAQISLREGDRAEALTLYQAYVSQHPDAPQAAAVRVEIDRLSSQPPPRVATLYGPAEAPEPPARPTVIALEPERPLYKKGWFWATLVGATLVAAGAVTLAVVLTSSDSSSPSSTPSTSALQVRF
jgi:hypothetical protein